MSNSQAKRIQYPAAIRRCSGNEYLVCFRNLPGTNTSGATLAEAKMEAADALGSAIAQRIADRDLVAAPSRPARGEQMIPVPLWIAGKRAVYLAMREAGIANVALAKRLGVTEAVVRRLLDPGHETKERKLTAALAALGRELVMAVVPGKVA